MTDISQLSQNAITLLKHMITVPSFSREEQGTAKLLQSFLQSHGINPHREMNNVWATNKHFDPRKPSILLCSHHDTVKPNKDYTLNPFNPVEDEGKLFGLGSNDAGGCLVSLTAAFLHFYERTDLKANLVLLAAAEEEISGTNGVEAVLPELGNITYAIVGEPTQMQMAVAEKGLLVLDCECSGRSGHAAREEGENAIYKAVKDIEWFRTYEFPQVSALLGKVKMSVTMIQAGVQHNVVPATCKFTVDVRVNDCYTHEDILNTIAANISATVTPRSLRLKPSRMEESHPLVQAGKKIGRNIIGSATLSDKALMPFPALKIGPGDSARSHTADEFIYTQEITDGIDIYIQLLNEVL
ncbi:M20 family metallo-hydrolase [Rurimicrobium arvi]|uniref:M20 family metallo-hydrolase n=1 Tax=Rurimicrobium arvi TaxID=2049916 RepID=A0ABP8MTT7_9BACT